MSTEWSDGKTVHGTNRNEALLAQLRPALDIWAAGKRFVQNLNDTRAALRPAHHNRNVAARKRHKATREAAAA